MRARHLIRGRDAESRARRYLGERGLACVSENYRCQAGEIDLIMREGQVVVFVEVRYRSDRRYGGALESIDARKQRRLRTTAQHYLQRKHRGPVPPCRFDVVLITGSDGGGDAGIEWIRDAF